MDFDQTVGMILCCTCGTVIEPNPSNMCLKCIMSRVDVTEGIPKQVEGFFCKGCGRYLSPPNHWLVAELESKELLTYCLKRIRGLNKVRLIDAGFVWTEPHSKRLKVKLKIQKEVFNGTIVQQDFIVEMVLQNHFCPECHRIEAKDSWNAVAQVRQHVPHKRTFLWIEQLIIKHKAQTRINSIKEEPDGLDFYFQTTTGCVKFINFLQSIVPVTFKQSKQLISADVKSNLYNYKYTYSVEIPPICRDDLVCLPIKLANQLGGISPLVLCNKVSNSIYLIDPFTTQVAEIADAARYWAYSFKPIASRDRLEEYIIIDIDVINRKSMKKNNTTSYNNSSKYALAEATVAKAAYMKKSNKTYFTLTHLGNILNVGDSVWGYDLENANFNDSDIAPMKGKSVRSEIILVKKAYTRKNRTRKWKLAQLKIETGDSKDHHSNRKARQVSTDQNTEEFMRDLEEDPEMRSQINLYKDPNHFEKEGNQMLEEEKEKEEEEEEEEEEEDDLPNVKVDELIDMMEDFNLGEGGEDEDEEEKQN